jgi:hypothetical protein
MSEFFTNVELEQFLIYKKKESLKFNTIKSDNRLCPTGAHLFSAMVVMNSNWQ